MLAAKLVLMIPILAATEGVVTKMDEQFLELGNRYIEQSAVLSPVSATERGDHRMDGQLDQVGKEAVEKKADFYRRLLADLEKIDRDQLSRPNQVDFAMLQHHLRARLWSIEKLQSWAWNPLSYTGLVGDSIYGLTARPFAPVRERMANVASRLE